MKKKVLFIDRDGTLIAEPHDFQVDTLEKFYLLPWVISSLKRLSDTGFSLVIVTNQDGLGSDNYPLSAFETVQKHLLHLCASEGISFDGIFYDTHRPEDNHPNRKPNTGMLISYLTKNQIDLENSYVIGDRSTDALLAANLGIQSITLKSPESIDGDNQYKEKAGEKTSVFSDWKVICDYLLARGREAEIQRITKETKITVKVNLDGTGKSSIQTGLAFFDHMLEQISRHGGIDLIIKCEGDLKVDAHHSIEDTAIALGEAVKKALGDKRGIERYAFTLPMDESLATCTLDLGGRPYFVWKGNFDRPMINDFPSEMVPHFFQSFSTALGANLHLEVKGENAHHMIEGAFKALAKCLKAAVKKEGTELPSTKGTL